MENKQPQQQQQPAQIQMQPQLQLPQQSQEPHTPTSQMQQSQPQIQQIKQETQNQPIHLQPRQMQTQNIIVQQQQTQPQMQQSPQVQQQLPTQMQHQLQSQLQPQLMSALPQMQHQQQAQLSQPQPIQVQSGQQSPITMQEAQRSTPSSQPSPLTSSPHVSTSPNCSVAPPQTVVAGMPHVARGVQGRGNEYIVLLAPNPRQPNVQGIRYPMTLNPSGLLQANPAMIRSINASQLIRTQTSLPGVLHTPTSQAQATSMANMSVRPVQLPFGTPGHGGQIRLANGQTLMNTIPMQRLPMMSPRATILQQPMMRTVGQPNMSLHPMTTGAQPMGMAIPTSMAPGALNYQGKLNDQNATAPSQMTPSDAINKGTSFFTRLISRMETKAKKKIMQNHIQSLIDGKTTSEEFFTAIQKELKSESTSQDQLVRFLNLCLPLFRQSMIAGTTTIDGLKPPPQNSQLSEQLAGSSGTLASPNTVQSSVTTPPAKKKKITVPGQKSAYAMKKEAREAKKREKESLAAQAVANASVKIDQNKDSEKPEPKPKPEKPKNQNRPKKQEKQLESLSSALRDDDDVNDVAAMGGVNLAEESQKIMASGAELVGTQIRSCRDEPFFDKKSLTARVARLTKQYNFPEPSSDVVALISHATQERMKTIVERLGILAEHRAENLKFNPKYEISSDVKGQVKFLAELDRIERRRNEEIEREQMIRIAKSRSKVEDPEQQKLRQKAKDMQRAEQEEVRQREANQTALMAIGPRKKFKVSSVSSPVSSFSQSSNMASNFRSLNEQPRSDNMRMVKRVNMRDLQTLFELDRTNMDRLVKLTSA